MNFLEKIYQKSPLLIQNAMISSYGYRLKQKKYGKDFNKYLREFKEREAYTAVQWQEYQTVELRKLLVHAFETVPFYHEKYKKYGFNTSKFQKFEIEDLKKLPYLEKEDFRKYGKTSLLSSKKRKGFFISSSGSTGTPTSTFYSNQFYKKWAAVYEARVRNWAEVHYKMPRGMIGGKNILTKANAKAPFYRFNIAEKQTYFSAYHISEKNAPNYVRGLIENNVSYLVGYAMSIYILADFINKLKLKSPKLISVLTSSEKLTEKMRNTIEKAFQCKVFDAYSGVEACGLISENKKGELLFSPDTGILEVMNSNGTKTKKGEMGEVISTGLINFDQPLIRYRIGDYVRVSKEQENKSGLHMLKIDEISGRLEDAIVTKDGRKIISLYRLFLDIPFLKLSQVIQHSFYDYEINIVIDKNFSKREENIIKERFLEKIGYSLNLKINRITEIKKTKSGKYRLTISNL